MSARLVGQPIRRVEDERFLRGRGRYTDDMRLEGQCHGAVVRSPHAHARIVSIDVERAQSMPGVQLILTATDVIPELRPTPTIIGIDPKTLLDRNGREMPNPPHWPLARDKARLAGDPVAFVVAETLEQAMDAAEQVEVDYEVLPAVVDFDEAMRPGAARVWDELASNVSFECEWGDREAVDEAFAGAAHVASVELFNRRQIVAFMEPRSVIAAYDAKEGGFTVHAGAQSAHTVRNVLCVVFGMEPSRIRVIVPDTGGGFGARNTVYPEFVLTAFAARKLARPVRFTATRGESFLTDNQARDQRVVTELALDAKGDFLALRAKALWRHGAYLPTRSLWVHISFMWPMLCGVYRIPRFHFELRGLFTNTGPVHAFRGVGRAEAAYLLERVVDVAARESGIDRVELRRRNLIPARNGPTITATGAEYGRCELERILDRALAAADWARFDERRRASRARGRLRGGGLAIYIESTGGAPSEFAEVEATPDGLIKAYVGTKSFGMGHETVFAQVLADELGVDFGRIRIIDGDTALVQAGFGSHGSRSMRIGGGALVFGTRKMIERGRELAARQLEASPSDIEYADGRFTITGTDRSTDLFDVARAASAEGERLAGHTMFETKNHAFANGCHVCEVEVDPETGAVSILNHVLVTDVGRVVNPLITEGQLHGGIAQGLGQAVFERVVYDHENGQLSSGSFMDYALPRADDLPWLETAFNEVPCEDNPLGAKGAGEGPTTGCPPAVINAIIDALSERGVRHFDMPATPERVWHALHSFSRA